MRLGDAILTASVRDERNHGWLSYKAPRGKRFVFLLLGEADKDAEGYDVDAALNALCWYFREPASCDTLPKGQDAEERLDAKQG